MVFYFPNFRFFLCCWMFWMRTFFHALVYNNNTLSYALIFVLSAACRIIPQLLNGLEKARFKRHLDNLLVIMAASVDSQLPLAVSSAEESLSLVALRIGPNVLRGRVENHIDSKVSRTLIRSLPPSEWKKFTVAVAAHIRTFFLYSLPVDVSFVVCSLLCIIVQISSNIHPKIWP